MPVEPAQDVIQASDPPIGAAAARKAVRRIRETDELGFQSVIDRVSIPDFHATLLHLLGFDHLRLTYPFQGVNARLSNVTKPGSKVIEGILA